MRPPEPVNHRPNFFARAKQVALAGLPARLQASAFRIYGGRRASRLESRARFAGIVWERTAAFSKELGYFPSIWLKLKGREPERTVVRADGRHE